MADDNWVETASMDDSIVVNLLLGLKYTPLHPSSSSPSSSFYSQPWIPSKPQPKPVVLPPLEWGHRQLRSKPPTTTMATTRCSPTTPLSWSVASASLLSSSDDGYDGSLSAAACRSKGTFANDSVTATNSKKVRKKKTFTELKEEESYLLKERVHLKKELASIHVSLNEQRSRSNGLKRIKLDFQERSPDKMLAISDEPVSTMSSQCYQTEASAVDQARLILPRHVTNNDRTSSDSCKVESQERCFVIPDLNMMPTEEELGREILYGMS